jgi:predicted dehydrogenase
MVGQVCRFAPGFMMAKALIDKGAIGELFFIESEYAHDYSEVAGWKNWRKSREIGRNGVIGGGCHAVDLLRWIGGDVAEVTALANHKMLPDWSEPDTTVACLKFREKGVIGKVFVSISVKRPYTMRSCFYGSKGSIVCDNTSPTIQFCTTEIPGLDGFAAVPIAGQVKNIPGEIAYLYEVISGKREHVLTADEGAKTVATCVAIIESARQGGKPTQVPDVS